jgi:hypothetical protein
MTRPQLIILVFILTMLAACEQSPPPYQPLSSPRPQT